MINYSISLILHKVITEAPMQEAFGGIKIDKKTDLRVWRKISNPTPTIRPAIKIEIREEFR
jgi:hypothetical protein